MLHNTQAVAFLTADEPVISVDTKKKELVGKFKNNGREWHRKGAPEADVNTPTERTPPLPRPCAFTGTATRRPRSIDAGFRRAALGDLGLLDITIDQRTDLHAGSETLDIADRFQLTLYDAAYLELAQRRSLPLATLAAALCFACLEKSDHPRPRPRGNRAVPITGDETTRNGPARAQI
jgi:Rhodopirellula transposase DDE domain